MFDAAEARAVCSNLLKPPPAYNARVNIIIFNIQMFTPPLRIPPPVNAYFSHVEMNTCNVLNIIFHQRAGFQPLVTVKIPFAIELGPSKRAILPDRYILIECSIQIEEKLKKKRGEIPSLFAVDANCMTDANNWNWFDFTFISIMYMNHQLKLFLISTFENSNLSYVCIKNARANAAYSITQWKKKRSKHAVTLCCK